MSEPKPKRRARRRGKMAVASSGGVSTLENPALWLQEVMVGPRTSSGEAVSHDGALALSTYWACLNNIAQDISKIPLQLRRKRDERGSDEALKHRVRTLVRRRPNPIMGPMQFRMTMQHRLLAWGNAYAEIVRDGTGTPVELWPVHPVRIKPVLGKDGRTLRYEYKPDGVTGIGVDLAPRDILHLRGLGSGIEGYSVVRFASETLGLGLAAQRHAGEFYGKGMGKRLVAVSKQIMGAKGRQAFRERLADDKANDAEGARRLPFLEGDIDLKDIGVPPDEAQFLETRTFQVPDVARWFRMALGKIQHEGAAKGWNSIESYNRDYASDALQPWAGIWEEELWLKLLTEGEQNEDRLYFHHVFQSLLKADMPARYTGYVQGVMNGWLSPNDVRELEDLPPIADPWADEYRQQAQMQGSRDAAPVTTETVGGAETVEAGERDDLEAMRPVFLDAATRMARIDANEAGRIAQRHAKDAAAYAASAQAWRLKHSTTVAEAFEPILSGACALTGRGVLGAQAAVDAYLALGVLDPRTTVEARAAALADAMMGLVR